MTGEATERGRWWKRVWVVVGVCVVMALFGGWLLRRRYSGVAGLVRRLRSEGPGGSHWVFPDFLYGRHFVYNYFFIFTFNRIPSLHPYDFFNFQHIFIILKRVGKQEERRRSMIVFDVYKGELSAVSVHLL